MRNGKDILTDQGIIEFGERGIAPVRDASPEPHLGGNLVSVMQKFPDEKNGIFGIFSAPFCAVGEDIDSGLEIVLTQLSGICCIVMDSMIFRLNEKEQRRGEEDAQSEDRGCGKK